MTDAYIQGIGVETVGPDSRESPRRVPPARGRMEAGLDAREGKKPSSRASVVRAAHADAYAVESNRNHVCVFHVRRRRRASDVHEALGGEVFRRPRRRARGGRRADRVGVPSRHGTAPPARGVGRRGWWKIDRLHASRDET